MRRHHGQSSRWPHMLNTEHPDHSAASTTCSCTSSLNLTQHQRRPAFTYNLRFHIYSYTPSPAFKHLELLMVVSQPRWIWSPKFSSFTFSLRSTFRVQMSLWNECPSCHSTDSVKTLAKIHRPGISKWPDTFFISHQTIWEKKCWSLCTSSLISSGSTKNLAKYEHCSQLIDNESPDESTT